MALSTTLTLRFNGAAIKRGLESIKANMKTAAIAAAAFGAATVAAGLAAAAGLVGLSMKINEIGEAGKASDERVKQIAESMGIFGDRADDVADRLNDLADTQGRLLGVDDDVIAATEAKLLTFKELAYSADTVGGAFDRATIASIDMAKAGFGEAEQNAVQLGKALNDPIKGINSLTKSGITFTAAEKAKIKVLVESGKMYEAQDTILKAIETQVGGTAAATAKASEKIEVSMSQLKEAFAIPFAEGFKAVPGMMENVFPMLKEKAEMAGKIIGSAISDAATGDFQKFITIGELIGESVKVGFLTAWQSIGTEMVRWLSDKSESMGFGKSIMAKTMEMPTIGELMQANITNSRIGELSNTLRPAASQSTYLEPTGPRMSGISQPGSASYISLAEAMKQMIAEQKITNQRLAPQP